MNALVDKFGDKIAVLGFPCNQFGHQMNETEGEFLNTLTHVRPGRGFEPKMDLFSKVMVNGSHAHPLFKLLRSELKYPMDDDETKDSKGNGAADVDVLVLPRGNFDNTTVVPWSPVTRTDLEWNFCKFIIDKDGIPIQRFSRFFPTTGLAAHIEKLL